MNTKTNSLDLKDKQYLRTLGVVVGSRSESINRRVNSVNTEVSLWKTGQPSRDKRSS